jgi:hypothetical protein
VVVGEEWQVVTTVAVELDRPVVTKVKGTSVANCGGDGWCWVTNGKWQ